MAASMPVHCMLTGAPLGHPLLQMGVSRSALAGGLNLMMHPATTEMYNVAGTDPQWVISWSLVCSRAAFHN